MNTNNSQNLMRSFENGGMTTHRQYQINGGHLHLLLTKITTFEDLKLPYLSVLI